jgi:hypothetical protein
VVLTDVAQKLSAKISDGNEDPACNHIAFDLGEPQLHLIEPRGELRMIMAELKRGFEAVIRTPNLESVPFDRAILRTN